MGTTLEQTDREQWEAYVRAELSKIETEGFDVFDVSKLRAARRSVTSDLAGWMGPWRNVRTVATQEFIWHVENYGGSRITWQEWQARRRAEREREAADAQDVSHVLASLEYMRDLMARRGELLATARAAGVPWSELCAASGLSRAQASTLAAAYVDAQPLADELI